MARSVTITFNLDEDVTPELFTGRVAFAVSKGCLRPGESLHEVGGDKLFTVSDTLEEVLPGVHVRGLEITEQP